MAIAGNGKVVPEILEVAAGDEAQPRTGKRDGDEGEDEQEDVCRICRTAGENGSPLYYPCACNGSIKYVHQDCLLQWLSHSNARQCEVCKHPFTFSPVYAENAPSRLSSQEFLLGLALKGGRGMHVFLRFALVLLLWLGFIPFTTFWIWRFTFVRSLLEMQQLFHSHMTPILVFTDCLHGFILSAGIVFIFLGATSLREYFRHLRELRGLDRAGIELEVIDRRPDARVGRRYDEVVVDDRLHRDPQAVAPGGANGEDGLGRGLLAGTGQLIRRNAENVAAHLEMQGARFEAHVEQMFDGRDDMDGAEGVALDELIGVQGPISHLFQYAFIALASNSVFLGVVALLPFTLGRIVLYLTSYMMPSSLKISIPVSSAFDLNSAFTVGNLTAAEFRSSFAKSSEDNPASPLVHIKDISESKAAEMMTLPEFSDAITVATGYGIIAAAVLFYFGIRALIKYSRQRLSSGRSQRAASLAETASAAASQSIIGFKCVITMVKVTFLLLVELGLFPLLCGWWLDICTLSMLGGTMASRLTFFWASPLTGSLLHWLVGIAYMLYISLFVSLLREVLRPGVLHFLRDPADPNYNPFHDLVEDPIHKHAFQIPADMLLFNICIPFAIEHFRPKITIKTILFYWFSIMGRALGLTEFLLPATESEGNVHGVNQIRETRADNLNGSLDVITVEQNADDQSHSEKYTFVFRILQLLMGAWLSLLLFNTTMMVLPLSLGRKIFSVISHLSFANGMKCSDFYALNIGCHVIWSIIALVRYAVDYLKMYNAKFLARQAIKWSAILTKSILLLSFWIIVIPVLIGLLFELLVVIPLRVPIDESPVFLLYQDWALGLLFLKIWTRLVMMGYPAPTADESWRMKFERVKADGFTRLRGLWVMQEIVIPILMKLLTALCVPYVFARGLFPVLGCSLLVNSAVYRFAWFGFLLLRMLWYGVVQLQQWAAELHNSIRDDRYLIGKQLHNFGERASEQLTVDEDMPSSTALATVYELKISRVNSEICQSPARLTNSNTVCGSSEDMAGEKSEVHHENSIYMDMDSPEKSHHAMGLKRRYNGTGSSSDII
ncbi:hypothetical protein KP509_11G040700 [Ceratopteris richardii]|uniref:RING-type E3 ubiquitin transferase n=1 Tax=Ceratopteris richardii TaxID=49495 RepID=A0A8T2TQT0_CERRI|nr:hypothetical protein KP509_11G040700 [Ceratopteris richardii]